jgi:segregation and condensation protein A
LLINDISLAQVADEYLEHINQHDHFPTHDVAQFLVVASTLVLIKSRSLLPEFVLTVEEEHEVQDLEQRLAMYKRIQAFAKSLAGRWGTVRLYGAADVPPTEPVFAPHAVITLENLQNAIRAITSRFPKPEVLKKTIVEKIISLEEMMDTMADRMKQALKTRFSEFAQREATRGTSTEREVRVNTIVSFLAMLELVKQGALMVRQYTAFDDIEMETDGVGVPRY